MAKTIYTVQLMDQATGKAIITSGGKCMVVTAGGTSKKTLLNAITAASLTNPISATRGNLSFAIDSVSPLESTVDLYGMAPGGQFFIARSVKAGDPAEVWIDTRSRDHALILPFDITADMTAATEYDTGFDFPTNTMIMPWPTILVTAADSGITIDAGLLSSESGGDADGFIIAASVASAVGVTTKLLATATLGALLRESVADSGSATSPTRIPYRVGSTAVSFTMTLLTAADTAKGFVEIPYRLPLTA